MDTSRLLAFAVLFAGLLLLAYPLFVGVLNQAAQRRSSDWALAGVTLLLMALLTAAAWTVWFAETQPAILWPVALCILIFRLVSPAIFLRAVARRFEPPEPSAEPLGLHDPLEPPAERRRLTEPLLASAAVLMGFYVLISPTLADLHGQPVAWSEQVITTGVVVYSFSQLYLYLFLGQMRRSPVLFAWLAGLLLGVGLVLLVPLHLEGFEAAFLVVSCAGWFLAVLALHIDRRRRNSELQRQQAEA